ETQTVEFTLLPEQFAARDENNLAVVEPGKVLISIGGKQPDEKSITDKQVQQCEVLVKGDTFIINN
ncbi:MAG: hypothetical protein WCS79_10990, partial [Paludibacter sp.]